jgi:plasmid stabilization system protein ParE
MNVRFLTVAQREVNDAVLWYEEQAEGLSHDFLDQLDRAVRLIKRYPLIATQIEPDIRRFLFARFPYSLIYGIDDDTIVVIAVAHQHRQPRYWADRMNDFLKD